MSLFIGFKFSLLSSLFTFLSSFCLALFTDAKLLSLVSISSLRALDTVSLSSLFFVPNFVFLSLLSISPFNLFVALCSASLRLSKSLVVDGIFDEKLDFKGVFLLKFNDGFDPNGLLKFPLLEGLLFLLSITTVFFP